MRAVNEPIQHLNTLMGYRLECEGIEFQITREKLMSYLVRQGWRGYRARREPVDVTDSAEEFPGESGVLDAPFQAQPQQPVEKQAADHKECPAEITAVPETADNTDRHTEYKEGQEKHLESA